MLSILKERLLKEQEARHSGLKRDCITKTSKALALAVTGNLNEEISLFQAAHFYDVKLLKLLARVMPKVSKFSIRLQLNCTALDTTGRVLDEL